jgi:hypothetical protein
MTEFVMPPLVVDHDENWLAVDLWGDLGNWARRAARDAVSRMPGHPGRRTEKHMVSVLEAAGAIARKPQDAALAYLLAPDVNDKIKAVVRFCPMDLAGWGEGEAWPELVRALCTDDPPDVTEIATGAGLCRRIRQRYAAGEGPERPVGQYFHYVWILPRWGAAVVMTTAFDELLEAGRWQAALDKLATGVGLETEAGPPSEETRSH